MVWSKTNGRSLLSGVESGGKSEWDWGEKRKIRLKNTIETDKEKIKERKQERKKWQFRRLKAVENKGPKVLDAKVEYIYHKKLEMKDVFNL